MIEGPARDDASDAVDPRTVKPGATEREDAHDTHAQDRHAEEPGGLAPQPLDPQPQDAKPQDAHQQDVDPQHADPQDGHAQDAHAQDAHVQDQPTRPAYGHLYGVERSLDSFLPLQDVVLAVDEAFLEALRDFAAQALAEMRRLGADYDHLHFRDVAQVWHESWPDIILVAPRAPADASAQSPRDDDAQDAASPPDR